LVFTPKKKKHKIMNYNIGCPMLNLWLSPMDELSMLFSIRKCRKTRCASLQIPPNSTLVLLWEEIRGNLGDWSPHPN
jgi:hypothetical protein